MAAKYIFAVHDMPPKTRLKKTPSKAKRASSKAKGAPKGKAKAKARRASSKPGKAKAASKNSQTPATPVRIVLKHHDTLGKHGYKDVKHLTATERHAALLGAIAEFGPTYVIRKLNVLAIYNKAKNPTLSALFRADIAFVQRVRNAQGKSG